MLRVLFFLFRVDVVFGLLVVFLYIFSILVDLYNFFFDYAVWVVVVVFLFVGFRFLDVYVVRVIGIV